VIVSLVDIDGIVKYWYLCLNFLSIIWKINVREYRRGN